MIYARKMTKYGIFFYNYLRISNICSTFAAAKENGVINYGRLSHG